MTCIGQAELLPKLRVYPQPLKGGKRTKNEIHKNAWRRQRLRVR